MKLRFVLTAVATVVTLAAGGLVAGAHAADATCCVGGGAAGIQAESSIGSPTLFQTLIGPYDGGDQLVLDVVTPRVELPSRGGSETKAIVNQKVGPVSVRALKVSIHGDNGGNPYAEATTSLAGVNVVGTDIHAIDTHCRWDSAGPPVASTSILGVGGKRYDPAPNTTRNIPGLGTLVLNEQKVEEFPQYAEPNATFIGYVQVIYVYGAHLHLNANAQLIYNTTDIILGFTSCDPLQIPALSGLRLVQPST